MTVGATTEHVATTERDHLLQQVQIFANEEVVPRVKHMERTGDVDCDLAKLMARQGWNALTWNRDYGGLGLGNFAKLRMLEILSTASGAAGATGQASTIPAEAVVLFGNEEQLDLLPLIASGECIPTICTTEPNAGGNIIKIESTATRSGRGWVLDGEKAFIGNASVANLHVVIARTGKEPKDLSAFIVEGERPGIEIERTPLIGFRGFSCDRVKLKHCWIPDGNLLGEVGDGMLVAHAASIRSGRPNLAAVALGIHQAAWELTYREIWETSRLADQQILRHRVAHARATLETSRLALYAAVTELDRGQDCDEALIAAKYTVTNAAREAANIAQDNAGARGLLADSPHDRLCRDVKCTWPPAGTGDAQLHRIDAMMRSDHPPVSLLSAPPLKGMIAAV